MVSRAGCQRLVLNMCVYERFLESTQSIFFYSVEYAWLWHISYMEHLVKIILQNILLNRIVRFLIGTLIILPFCTSLHFYNYNYNYSSNNNQITSLFIRKNVCASKPILMCSNIANLNLTLLNVIVFKLHINVAWPYMQMYMYITVRRTYPRLHKLINLNMDFVYYIFDSSQFRLVVFGAHYFGVWSTCTWSN